MLPKSAAKFILAGFLLLPCNYNTIQSKISLKSEQVLPNFFYIFAHHIATDSAAKPTVLVVIILRSLRSFGVIAFLLDKCRQISEICLYGIAAVFPQGWQSQFFILGVYTVLSAFFSAAPCRSTRSFPQARRIRHSKQIFTIDSASCYLAFSFIG